MRQLASGTNVDAPSGDYPKGRPRDRVGATPGTILNEVLHGDLIQLMQKLIIDAGITENDTPDNVSNGYQLLDALVDKIKKASGFRASTNTLANAGMTASEKDIITFIPHATNAYSHVKVDFSAEVGHQTGGSNQGLKFRLYIGGVLKKERDITTFTDGRATSISFSFAGFPYAAGDIVKVTGEMTGETSTIDANVSLNMDSITNSVLI